MPELVGYRLRRPEMIRLVLFALAVAAGLAAYFHWVPGLELIFLDRGSAPGRRWVHVQAPAEVPQPEHPRALTHTRAG